MEAYLPLVVFILVPLLLVILLKTSAAIFYFCVASAFLLVRFIDQDAARTANALLPSTGVDYMALTVLIIPTIIAAFVFRKTVKTHMLPLHLLVAVLSGLTLSLVASNFLPSSFLNDFEETEVWEVISDYQTIIVGGGFLLSVLCL